MRSPFLRDWMVRAALSTHVERKAEADKTRHAPLCFLSSLLLVGRFFVVREPRGAINRSRDSEIARVNAGALCRIRFPFFLKLTSRCNPRVTPRRLARNCETRRSRMDVPLAPFNKAAN